MLHEEAARQLLQDSGALLPYAYLMDNGQGTITAMFGEVGDRSSLWQPCGVRAQAWAERCCQATLALPW